MTRARKKTGHEKGHQEEQGRRKNMQETHAENEKRKNRKDRDIE